MTDGEFILHAGRALYGELYWRRSLREALGVNDSSIKSWSSGARDVPPGVIDDVVALLAQAAPTLRQRADLAEALVEAARQCR